MSVTRKKTGPRSEIGKLNEAIRVHSEARLDAYRAGERDDVSHMELMALYRERPSSSASAS